MAEQDRKLKVLYVKERGGVGRPTVGCESVWGQIKHAVVARAVI